ncbi:glycosyltransferase [Nocardioides sp. Kera G14]|uniref:glycosyltransferase n=1 Tax=Nocardioides sp. Kera G14 TaxID=2884264 RepID=UPI001D107A32|nr:glycosyltransferase [Nocardioides sp. Kera G14]UDY22757.1 glycosyltransferase [Nocardioides sp. Kera G14]
MSTMTETRTEKQTVTRLLQRQIMPLDRDIEVMALYVDLEDARLDEDKYVVGGTQAAKDINNTQIRQATSSGRRVQPEQLIDRTRFKVLPGQSVSFGTFFNGFAASYWRRWTVVESVTLNVTVEGADAHVIVYKSLANGNSQRVDAAFTESQEATTFTFELSLGPFVDGGWYWYDVVGGLSPAVVSAEWTAEVPAERGQHGTVDMAITTMNRPEFCAKLLQQLGDADLAPYLDTVFVMEQGSKLVKDSDEFPAAQAVLGEKLRIIEQGNLGGSGGYARGQLESLTKGTATYALMMDDDVVCEPESVIRQVVFGDLSRRPTIVGGMMFNLYSRSRLHSFGEIIQPWRFWWLTPEDAYVAWDFSTRNIRSARWLHKRWDVDFNGWYSCLIPLAVMREIGLSLPLFIKWDDSEYGLRAQQHGFPTVTLPGAAVWHVPWSDKNDALDWQAYFHHRNRIVAALLHSIYPKGGRLLRESRNNQIAHLVSMQYSTAELRLQAMEDVLKGPQHLHEMLPTRLAEVNAFRKEFSDARLIADRDDLPPVRRTKPPKKGRSISQVPSRRSQLISAALAPIRQFKPTRPLAEAYPEAEVPAADAKWYKLSSFDSAIVSMNDGTSAALYQRDPERYRELLKRTLAIHERYRREWPALAEQYRAALKDITSPETWAETFKPWTDTKDEA